MIPSVKLLRKYMRYVCNDIHGFLSTRLRSASPETCDLWYIWRVMRSHELTNRKTMTMTKTPLEKGLDQAEWRFLVSVWSVVKPWSFLVTLNKIEITPLGFWTELKGFGSRKRYKRKWQVLYAFIGWISLKVCDADIWEGFGVCDAIERKI